MLEYDFKNQEIADIVNTMIIYAVSQKASDIHFDPFEDGVKVRFRIDGVLQIHTIVPLVYQRNLITRIKLISNMNITESRLPQDGAIKGSINGIDLDMRVSTLNTNLGEKVVIRILDYTKKGRFHCLFRLIKEPSLCLPEVYVFPDLPHIFFKYRKFKYRKV